MSSQYKVKKYLNKLEGAKTAVDMDKYYGKIKKYKIGQRGGAVPEELKKNISEKGAVPANISINKEKIKEISEKIDKLGKYNDELESTLKESFAMLNNIDGNMITKEINEIYEALEKLNIRDAPNVPQERIQELYGESKGIPIPPSAPTQTN